MLFRSQLKVTSNTETGYGKFFDNDKLFNIKKVVLDLHTNFPKNLRMSLDYEEDFKIAEKIFKKFGNDFHIEDILKFLSTNPKISDDLNNIQKKWDEHWNKNLADSSMREA